ncbi:MAG: S26 family signal peptidase [Pseudonocardia sp.]
MSWLGWARVLVRGPSMSPDLADGDVLLVRFPPDASSTIRPGDVVLVRWSARPGQLSVKRAVRAVPDGWEVRGDNRFGSTDSRQLGPAEVLGVARWRLWPRPRRLGGAGGRSGVGGRCRVGVWNRKAGRGQAGKRKAPGEDQGR